MRATAPALMMAMAYTGSASSSLADRITRQQDFIVIRVIGQQDFIVIMIIGQQDFVVNGKQDICGC